VLQLQTKLQTIARYPDKLAAVLRFVQSHPDTARFVGVMVLSTFEFGTNTTILASFFRQQTNSVRFNFRKHGLSKTRLLHANPSDDLPDARHWRVYRCSLPLLEGNPRTTFRYQGETKSRGSSRDTPCIPDVVEPEQPGFCQIEIRGEESDAWLPDDDLFG
jgi:hypothetical protein